MMDEVLATWRTFDRNERLSSPEIRYRGEWLATQRIEKLEAQLQVERARLGEQLDESAA
jgi:hypothetical protein